MPNDAMTFDSTPVTADTPVPAQAPPSAPTAAPASSAAPQGQDQSTPDMTFDSMPVQKDSLAANVQEPHKDFLARVVDPVLQSKFVQGMIGGATGYGGNSESWLDKFVRETEDEHRMQWAAHNSDVGKTPESIARQGEQAVNEYAQKEAAAKEQRSEPIVDLTKTMTPEEQANHPIARGLAEFGTGMTTGENLTTMLISGALGKIPGAAGKIIPRLASAGFSSQQIYAAWEQIPDMKKAWANGDVNEAEHIMTLMTAELVSSAAGGEHAVAGESKPLMPGMDRAINRYAQIISQPMVDAARAARTKVATGLENVASRGEAKVAAHREALAQIERQGMQSKGVADNALKAGILTPEEHAKITANGVKPEDRARFLHNRVTNDVLQSSAPQHTVETTATDDGVDFLMKAKKAAAVAGSDFLKDPVINEVIGKPSAQAAATLSKKLASDTVTHLRDLGQNDLANSALQTAENHVFREAAIKPEKFLDNLNRGYDTLRKNGLTDVSPDIARNAQTVRDLVTLRDQVQDLQAKYPDQTWQQKLMDTLTGRAAKSVGSSLLGIIGGHALEGGPGGVALGLGASALLGTGKWILSQDATVLGMSKAARALADTIKPEEGKTEAGKATAKAAAPAATPAQPAAQPEAAKPPTETPQGPVISPRGVGYEGTPVASSNGQPIPPEATPAEPAAPAAPAQETAPKPAEQVPLPGEESTANAEPVETAKAALKNQPPKDALMDRINAAQMQGKTPEEVSRIMSQETQAVQSTKPTVAAPEESARPKEEADFIDKFKKEHPEVVKPTHGEVQPMTDDEIAALRNQPRNNRKFFGTFATKDAALARQAENPGSELFQYRYNSTRGGGKQGYYGVMAGPETAPVTLDKAVATHDAEHPDDVGKSVEDKIDTYVKEHGNNANSIVNPPQGSKTWRDQTAVHEMAHALLTIHNGGNVFRVSQTPWGAQASIDFGDVKEFKPGDADQLLTNMAGGQAAAAEAYKGAVAGSQAGEEAAGTFNPNSPNWDGNIVGSDRQKFNRVLDAYGVPKGEWDAQWDKHVEAGRQFFRDNPQAIDKVRDFMKSDVGDRPNVYHRELHNLYEDVTGKRSPLAPPLRDVGPERFTTSSYASATAVNSINEVPDHTTRPPEAEPTEGDAKQADKAFHNAPVSLMQRGDSFTDAAGNKLVVQDVRTEANGLVRMMAKDEKGVKRNFSNSVALRDINVGKPVDDLVPHNAGAQSHPMNQTHYTPTRLFSLSDDNPKTVKGETVAWYGKAGIKTGILYLKPSDESCPFRTPGCGQGCLYTAGNHAWLPTKIAGRVNKTQYLLHDPEGFIKQANSDIQWVRKQAETQNMFPAIRTNGTSDLPHIAQRLAKANPDIQFYDYTKIPEPWKRAGAEAGMPNYHLTFSRSEHNWSDCVAALDHGVNVAAVFKVSKAQPLPETYMGYKVIDGDFSDARFTDPEPGADGKGYIVGLKAKGKAKSDTSGFVIQPGQVESSGHYAGIKNYNREQRAARAAKMAEGLEKK